MHKVFNTPYTETLAKYCITDNFPEIPWRLELKPADQPDLVAYSATNFVVGKAQLVDILARQIYNKTVKLYTATASGQNCFKTNAFLYSAPISSPLNLTLISPKSSKYMIHIERKLNINSLRLNNSTAAPNTD